jgi:hypothetical protein
MTEGVEPSKRIAGPIVFGVVLPVILIAVATVIFASIGIRTGSDITAMSFASFAVISACGFIVLTRQRTPLEKLLIAAAYFPALFFLWFNLSFVSVAVLGGRGNP